MIKIDLLSKIQVNVNEINLTDSGTISKLEKNLRLEAKLNPDIQLTDIELLMQFLKEHTTTIQSLLADPIVYKILIGDYENISFYKVQKQENNLVYEKLISENFKEQVLNFVNYHINDYMYFKVILLKTNYPFLFGFEILEELETKLASKVSSFAEFLSSSNDIRILDIKHFSTQSEFFEMLSLLNNYFFDGAVMQLNSAVANLQHVENIDKASLGRVLIALGAYNSVNEEVNDILKRNARVGKGWQSSTTFEKSEGMLARFISFVFGLLSSGSVVVYFLSVSVILLILFGYYKLYQNAYGYFWLYTIVSGLILLVTRNKYSEHTDNDSNYNPIERKFIIAMLMLLVPSILSLIVCFAVVIVIAVISLGSGFFPIGILIYFIAKIFSKKSE